MEIYNQAFIGDSPDLIGPIMKETLSKIKTPNNNPEIIPNITISDTITGFITQIYKKYIQNNKLAIFIILLVIIFLIYRYYKKKQTDKISGGEKKQDLDYFYLDPYFNNYESYSDQYTDIDDIIKNSEEIPEYNPDII